MRWSRGRCKITLHDFGQSDFAVGDAPMAAAGVFGRRARARGFEILESRSLLSILNLGITDYTSAPAPVEQTHSEVSVVKGVEVNAPLSRSVLHNNREPYLVITGYHGTGAASNDLIIEIGGEGNLGSIGVGGAHLDGGWIILDLELPAPISQPTNVIGLQGPGGVSFGIPGQIVDRPASQQERPTVADNGSRVNVIERRIPIGSLPLLGVSDSQVPTGTRSTEQRSVRGHELSDERSAETVQRATSTVTLMPTRDPAIPKYASESILQNDRLAKMAEDTDSAGMRSAHDESIAGELESIQGASKPVAVTEAGGMVAESIKGIKIRGTIADPSGGAHAKSFVDLAVIEFERPMTVRLQLPFIVGAEQKMSQAVSLEAGSVAPDSVVQAVDTVLAESESTALCISDWRISGGLVVFATAVGYFVGSRRGSSSEAAAVAASMEPFTPIFSEAQLSRLSRRLGANQRGRMASVRQGLLAWHRRAMDSSSNICSALAGSPSK